MTGSNLKISAIMAYATIFSQLIYNLAVTPIIIRVFGQSEYGVYSLCASVITYLSLFQFGFGATYLRYFIRFQQKGVKQKTEELNGMFLEIFIGIAVAVAIVGTVLVFNSEAVLGGKLTATEHRTAKLLLTLMVFNISLSMVGVMFVSAISAHERFIFQKGLALADSLLKPIVLIPLLLMGYKAFALVLLTTLFSIVILNINIWYCITKLNLKFRFSNFDFDLFKEMGTFSFFIFLQGIMDVFNWQIDKFLLTRFWGSTETAIYAVGAQFNAVFIALAAAMTGFFIPKVNQLVANRSGDEMLSDIVIKIGRLQFIICTFLFSSFIFFGKPFVQFFAGKGYENAYYVAILLISPLVIPLSMDLCYHIARAKAKHKVSTTVFAVVALFNMLISIPLCKRYGEIGSAFGTFIGMFLANNIFQYIYSERVVGIDMKRWSKNIVSMLPALIPPVVVGTVIMLFVNTYEIAVFVETTLIFSLVFAVSMWFLGLNTDEREMFSRSVTNMWRRK